MLDWNENPVSEFKFIPFDIETTGLAGEDEVTTITLLDKTSEMFDVFQVFAQVPDGFEGDSESLEDSLDEMVMMDSYTKVSVSLAEDEQELLEEFESFVKMSWSENKILCAWNGQTWNGGFDLPQLRTAANRNGVMNPVRDVPYLDVKEIVESNFNLRAYSTLPSGRINKPPLIELAHIIGVDPVTDHDVQNETNRLERIKSLNKDTLKKEIEQMEDVEVAKLREWAEEHNDGNLPTTTYSTLDEVYDFLCGDELNEVYDDSVEAVTDWENGNLKRIIQHNIIDVEKTERLMDKVQKQVKMSRYRPS